MLLSSALAACGPSLGSARSAYHKGDYPAAKEALLAIETEEVKKGGCARAEYELYRGLTHLGLGDKSAARTWLGWAKGHSETIFRENLHSCFGREDISRMDLALETLGSR